MRLLSRLSLIAARWALLCSTQGSSTGRVAAHTYHGFATGILEVAHDRADVLRVIARRDDGVGLGLVPRVAQRGVLRTRVTLW